MSIMRLKGIVGAFALIATLCGPGRAFAQTAPAPPSMKTIGTPAAVKPEIAPSLIVLNSDGATLQGDTLVLTGVVPNSIIFADRPVRSATGTLSARDVDLASFTFAAAQTAKQQCINICRARYRTCLSLKQIPSSECRGVYEDCNRFTCKAVQG